MPEGLNVIVDESEHNGAYRWLVCIVDPENPRFRHTVYGALTEDEATEVSHAVASTITWCHKLWTVVS